MPRPSPFRSSADENDASEPRIFTEFNLAMLALVAAAFAVVLFAAVAMSSVSREGPGPAVSTVDE